MRILLRAHETSAPALLRRCCCLLAFGLGPVAGALATTPPAVSSADDNSTTVHHFDFNERPLGNYENMPMYWMQMREGTLRQYQAGGFDDAVGHEAPPSFAVQLRGGSLGFEYQRVLPVEPGADYVVTGHVRSVGLRHARACLHVFLVDARGEPVPGSDRAGAAENGDPAAGDRDAWQRVEVAFTNDFPAAAGMILRLWILQPTAWSATAAGDVDPIVREDLRATVWFDDITIYRLPRVRMWFKQPGGVVPPGHTGSLLIDVRGAGRSGLVLDVLIEDETGTEVDRVRREAPFDAGAPVQIELPSLPAGRYTARLWARAADDTLARRAIGFAVLPELPLPRRPARDFGVDLGLSLGGRPDDVTALLEALHGGGVRVAVPLAGGTGGGGRTAHLDNVLALAEVLAGTPATLVGALAPPLADGDGGTQPNMRWLLTRSPDAVSRFAPVLTRLGDVVAMWQLGQEPVEGLATWWWEGADVTEARRRLGRFVAAPRLVVPYSVFDGRLSEAGRPTASTAAPATEPAAAPVTDNHDIGPAEAISIHVPPSVSAHSFAQQLAFLALGRSGEQTVPPDAPAKPPVERWLHLDGDERGLGDPRRLAELARRIVLAKALGADRIFVPAPFALSAEAGPPTWEPTEFFIPLRTLFHALSGRPALAAVPLPEQDGVGIFFGDGESACVVAWTWRERPAPEPVALRLGTQPAALHLCGRRTALEVRDGIALVNLSPMPLILTDIDAPLALLHASCRIAPTTVEPNEGGPRPTVRFRNYYREPLVGYVQVTPPENWRVTPHRVEFELQPDEVFEQSLELRPPRRELALPRLLSVRVELRSPVKEVLDFPVTVGVGQREAEVRALARWEGEELVVEQRVENRGAAVLSFNSFCRVPGRPPLEAAILDLRPGEARQQVFRLGAADELRGATLRVGLQQIRGRRYVEQLVEVPP